MANTKIPLELTAYAPDADGATLELQTTDTTVTDGSVLGKIEFKAPKEASGTDAILVGAAIEAVAEGTFAADNNATELVFKTGASEAAAQKMVLTSAGNLGVGVTPTAKLSLPAQASGDSGIARFAIESGVDSNDFTISQYEDGTGTYTLMGQNISLNSGGNVTVLDSAHKTAGVLFDGRGNGQLQFYTGAANASSSKMTVDSAGNVGIGTSSPDGMLHTFTSDASITPDADADDLIIEGNGATGITIGSSASSVGSIRFADSGSPRAGMIYYNHVGNEMRFYTGATERVRIDSSGNVGIGTSSPAHKLDIYDGTLQINAPSGTGNAWTYYRNTDRVYLVGCRGSGGDVLAFYDLSADTQRMQIETSGNIGAGGSSTNIYNASDERLKENILPLSNSLDTIKKLNPVKFNWIDNFAELEKDKTLYGFVAQEVQDVFPDAVQPFCDGKPVTVDDKVIENPLTVREKFLVPMLVKAIQEQQVIIDDLKSRIKTLEDA